jgi:hypothetical protein
MRLTTVILIASLMQVSANSLAQKITLSKSNAGLPAIFKELKAQSGYNFFYTDNLLKDAKPVTIKVNSAEFENVLKLIFADQPFSYEINSKTVVIKEKAKEPSFMDNLVARFKSIDAQLDFTWEVSTNSMPGAATDKAVFIVYNPSKQEFVMSGTGPVRSTLSYDMALPSNFSGDSVQVWLVFVSADGKKVSDTQFIAATVVQ